MVIDEHHMNILKRSVGGVGRTSFPYLKTALQLENKCVILMGLTSVTRLQLEGRVSGTAGSIATHGHHCFQHGNHL